MTDKTNSRKSSIIFSVAKIWAKVFLILISIGVALIFLVAGFDEYPYHQQEANGLQRSNIQEGQPYDAVIVLGAGVADNGSITPLSKTRMDKALSLYRDKKVKMLVLTGGFTNSNVRKSEAESMRDYALQEGVPESDIIVENMAGNTAGNAYYTKTKILEPNDWNRNIVVTNDFHLVRSRLIFSKVLGEKYITDYLAADSELAQSEFRKNTLMDRGYFLLYRLLFIGIRDGDHEKVAVRFNRAGAWFKRLRLSALPIVAP